MEPAAGEPASTQPPRAEQAPVVGSSQADRATLVTAPVAADPGEDAGSRRSEAEQALRAIIEPVSTSGPPAEPGQAADSRPPQSGEVPAAASLDGTGQDDLAAEAAETISGLDTDGQISPGASAERVYYAATASVNLRDGPGLEAEVVTVLDEGDRVRRLGSVGDWLLVEYDNRGTGIVTGWVYGRFLRPIESPS